MGIIDNAKEVANLVREIGNMELYRKILDLQSEIIDLSNKNFEKEKEFQKLRDEFEINKKMVFKKPFYYIEDDDQPFCPKCWETKKIAIHLSGMNHHKSSGYFYECRNCYETFKGN